MKARMMEGIHRRRSFWLVQTDSKGEPDETKGAPRNMK